MVWSNCRGFNEPDSEISDLADQAQQALRMRWQQEGLPTVTPIPPSANNKQQKKKSGKKHVLDAGEPVSGNVTLHVYMVQNRSSSLLSGSTEIKELRLSLCCSYCSNFHRDSSARSA